MKHIFLSERIVRACTLKNCSPQTPLIFIKKMHPELLQIFLLHLGTVDKNVDKSVDNLRKKIHYKEKSRATIIIFV